MTTTGELRSAPARRAREHPSKVDTFAGWTFLLPFLLLYLIFFLYPVIQAVFMGFFDWDLLNISNRTFVGLENYGRMIWGTNMTWDVTHLLLWRLLGLASILLLWRWKKEGRIGSGFATGAIVGMVALFAGLLGVHPGAGGRWYDAQFWPSFGNTTLFVVMSTPLIVGLGLAIALALNRPGRFAGLLRTAFFTPFVLSVSVLTLIWSFLLSPDLGLISAAFKWLGLTPINFLGRITFAMPAIVVTTMWWTVGFNIVLFLAGLQDIDSHQYEAASIDGANRWHKFRFVTIPGLRRTLLLVIILQVIASFQIFGQVFILTKGGPSGTTRVLVQHIYQSSFRDFNLGYASAMSVFLFVAILAISAIQFPLFRSEDD